MESKKKNVKLQIPEPVKKEVREEGPRTRSDSLQLEQNESNKNHSGSSTAETTTSQATATITTPAKDAQKAQPQI